MTNDPSPYLTYDDIVTLTEQARQRRVERWRRAQRLDKWSPSSARVARAARALDRALDRTIQPRDELDYLAGNTPPRYEPADLEDVL